MERRTRQRDAIQGAIEAADRPMSPQEVLREARKGIKNLGLATVYRTIKALVADGSLRAVDIPGETARYERAGKAHHHHFHCTSCDRVFDMEGCVAKIADLAPPGFTVEQHEVILYGTCAACGRQK
ncbi:MAG TPA: transcriptional repressor [Kiritimatiellia bacterium]|jgi:Fur family ferric uptake transcriptional regulator